MSSSLLRSAKKRKPRPAPRLTAIKRSKRNVESSLGIHLNGNPNNVSAPSGWIEVETVTSGNSSPSESMILKHPLYAQVSPEQVNPYASSRKGNASTLPSQGSKTEGASDFDMEIRERANPFRMELENQPPPQLPQSARLSISQQAFATVVQKVRFLVWWVFENFTKLGIGLLLVLAVLPSHFSLTLTPSLLLLVIGGIYIGRSVWFSLPRWLQKHMRGEIDPSEGQDANDELASPVMIMNKLSDMFNLIYKQSDDLLPDDMPQYKIYVCVLSLLHLITELFHTHPDYRDKAMRQEGNEVSEEELRELQFYLNFADLAYEESPTELIIKLRSSGYRLMRHDVATEPGRVGHFIAIHHDKKEVVIALKGTSSVSDILTDLVGMAIPHTLENGKVIRCHEGMYTAALMMVDELQHMIENMFQPAGYSIKICGHSLGAGTGCLLGVFLKSMGIPVRVYAFATPACLSFDASMECHDYITSVVNNCDCVPRVSLVTIRTLNKLFLKIDEKLTQRGLSTNDWKSTRAYLSDISKIDSDLLMTPEELEEFHDKTLGEENGKDDYSLFVAGRVVSMWVCNSTTTEKGAAAVVDVDCRQMHGGMKTLRNIEISSSMILDHGTEPYKENLEALIRKAASAKKSQ